jgi:acyl-CoA synthetase (AMP-forming)/AMP-acid ligase II
VRFVEAVPRNPSGKILRKELREKAALEDTKAKL